jgi:hypothetical protein
MVPGTGCATKKKRKRNKWAVRGCLWVYAERFFLTRSVARIFVAELMKNKWYNFW